VTRLADEHHRLGTERRAWPSGTRARSARVTSRGSEGSRHRSTHRPSG
jgi:hypothetical protein